MTASRTCEGCGETEIETVLTSFEVTKPASCEAAGETTYSALFSYEAFSPQEKVMEAPEMLGHDWGPWTVTKKAAMTGKGTEERTCRRCGEKQIRSTGRKGSSSGSGSGASAPRTGD